MEKYTLEEFEKMFDEAQIQAIEEMINDIKKADKNKKMDDMHLFTFSMQNIMFSTKLKKILFRK